MTNDQSIPTQWTNVRNFNINATTMTQNLVEIVSICLNRVCFKRFKNSKH